MKFTSIDIIFNPKSTGSSKENAEELKLKLEKLKPEIVTSLWATEHAGHAEMLAYKLAKGSKSPLIISSSGDGGYNEVVNGVMKAVSEGVKPICAVLASGNANDHSRTLQEDSLFESIKSGKVQHIDLLKVTIKNKGQTLERYAHSYAGLGLTPTIAVELNKVELNAIKELLIVLRTFYKYRPFKISHGGKVLKLDSIIFANIGEMAKVLTISKKSKADDGLFEIVTFKHRPKIRLLRKLVKATVTGLESPKQSKRYDFTVLKNMPAQLDGEVIKIQKGSLVAVTSQHKILSTVL